MPNKLKMFPGTTTPSQHIADLSSRTEEIHAIVSIVMTKSGTLKVVWSDQTLSDFATAQLALNAEATLLYKES